MYNRIKMSKQAHSRLTAKQITDHIRATTMKDFSGAVKVEFIQMDKTYDLENITYNVDVEVTIYGICRINDQYYFNRDVKITKQEYDFYSRCGNHEQRWIN